MIFLNSNLAHNPVFVEGKGAYLIDRKGELAFDTWLGSGTLIFGHDKTTEKSEKLLPSGPDLDQLFFDNLSDCVDFSIGAIGFQTSGSSAVTRAVRLARAATRKDVVVVIGSFWHGSENEFLFKNDKRDISVGLTSNSHSDVVWFSSLGQALSCIDTQRTAAILVEPFQGADPEHHLFDNLPVNWRDHLREQNILLICDEIITGFRQCYGSCHISRMFDPDIVLFGKAIGGGFPVGVVVVNQDVLAEYEFSLPFWGGTFSASPIQLRAVTETLAKLKTINYCTLEKNLQKLIHVMKKHSSETGLSIKSGCNFARISGKVAETARSFVAPDKAFELMRRRLLKHERIFVGHNGLVFPSIHEYPYDSI